MTRLLPALFVASLALAGCCSDGPRHDDHRHHSSHGVGTVNSHCPTCGPRHPVSADAVVNFEGQRVGFCCEECIPAWHAMSTEERRARLLR